MDIQLFLKLSRMSCTTWKVNVLCLLKRVHVIQDISVYVCVLMNVTCCPHSRWSSCTSPTRSPGRSGTWPGDDTRWLTSPGTFRPPRSPSSENQSFRCTSGSHHRSSPECSLCFAPTLWSEREQNVVRRGGEMKRENKWNVFMWH